MRVSPLLAPLGIPAAASRSSSAIAWAPGADQYLRDCISLFEEYGWDWTYHAFREWGPWSVEHETATPGRPSVPAADTPRKRALLEGLRRR